MKKVLLRDREAFHHWQAEVSRNLDNKGQMAVSMMAPPDHYPSVLVWLVYEEIDGNSGMGVDIVDRFEYVYIYPNAFPHKEKKTGMYIYQIVRTSEAFEALMES